MAFTPLHRELGLEASDLTSDLLAAAVEQRVCEQDDLDWKQSLPVKDRHDEFAKDVAAMANSGGGLLVFGVKEQKDGTSAAGLLVHIGKWDDAEQRRLRQVAYSSIQPPVHGLRFHDIDSDGVRTVVLEIPASADAPHLVWSNQRFIAPLRYGAQTEFMNERQIEAAYALRRQARTELLGRLQDTAANVRAGGQSPQIGNRVRSPIRPSTCAFNVGSLVASSDNSWLLVRCWSNRTCPGRPVLTKPVASAWPGVVGP